MYLHAEELEVRSLDAGRGALCGNTLPVPLQRCSGHHTAYHLRWNGGSYSSNDRHSLSNEMASWNTVALSRGRRPHKKHRTHSGLLRSRNNSLAMVPSSQVFLRPHTR